MLYLYLLNGKELILIENIDSIAKILLIFLRTIIGLESIESKSIQFNSLTICNYNPPNISQSQTISTIKKFQSKAEIASISDERHYYSMPYHQIYLTSNRL